MPDHDGSVVWRAGSVEATACPLRIMAESGVAVLPQVAALIGEQLPYSGGVLDQPGLLMDAIGIYRAELEKLKPRKGPPPPPLPGRRR